MKILFVSLGCDKNLVDSEEMLGALRQAGYSFTDDEEEADIAVVNTCCFIMDAQKESIDQILALAGRRTEGQLKALIVTGCLAQRYKYDILKEIPEVDAVIGTTAEKKIVETLHEILANDGEAGSNGYLLMENENRRTGTAAERVVTTGGYYSYLKIAEGCDKRCTYCVIPYIRGHYRSMPMEELIAQAEALAAKGVRELILVAQETTLYGTDLYGYKALPDLLKKLSDIEGIEWIRLMYCYPEEITREIAEAIRDLPKVVHYIDMPVQHASDDILKRMGRQTNRRELTQKVAMLRELIPDICIRTTLISGFPGEREEDHRALLEFVEEMRFDRLGVFTYSREEGTPAAKMSPQVPARIRKKRQKELMLLQQKIAFEAAQDMEGRVVDAIVEGKLAGEPVYLARSYKDAPGVDGALFIETQRELMTGDLVKVLVTGSQEYDLIGGLYYESAE